MTRQVVHDLQPLAAQWGEHIAEVGCGEETSPEVQETMVTGVSLFLYWLKTEGYKLMGKDDKAKVTEGPILPLYRVIVEGMDSGDGETCDIAVSKGTGFVTMGDVLEVWEFIATMYDEPYHVKSIEELGDVWLMHVRDDDDGRD